MDLQWNHFPYGQPLMESFALARSDGNPRCLDGCINLPINELGKNLKLD
jgi:hypothetical protein